MYITIETSPGMNMIAIPKAPHTTWTSIPSEEHTKFVFKYFSIWLWNAVLLFSLKFVIELLKNLHFGLYVTVVLWGCDFVVPVLFVEAPEVPKVAPTIFTLALWPRKSKEFTRSEVISKVDIKDVKSRFENPKKVLILILSIDVTIQLILKLFQKIKIMSFLLGVTNTSIIHTMTNYKWVCNWLQVYF